MADGSPILGCVERKNLKANTVDVTLPECFNILAVFLQVILDEFL
jgi:hypothetical protein